MTRYLGAWMLLLIRGLLRAPLRSVLATLGVAIGVAVFTAVQIANDSLVAAFGRTIDAVAGRATLQVSAGGLGFDERLLLVIERTPGVEAAAPLIIALAPVADRPHEVLLVLGVDLLGGGALRTYEVAGEPLPLDAVVDPGTILLSEVFARGRGIKVGDAITLLTGTARRPFTVRGLLEPKGPARALEGHLALMDIAAAQIAFDRIGRLNRVNVLTRPGETVEAVRERLRGALPPHLQVERRAERNAQVHRMLGAFRLNLTALSAIALVVGLFVVYNAVALTVLQWRRVIGILRSLGCRPHAVAALFLAEAACIGTAGGALGLVGGRLLAGRILGAVSATVSSLYAYVRVEEVTVTPRVLLLGGILGLGMALLAALVPSLRAGRMTVRVALAEEPGAMRTPRRLRGIATAAGIVLSFAWLAARPGPVGTAPVWGYASLAALIGGGALLAPLAIAGCSRLLGRRRLWLAAASLRGRLGQHAVAVAAMMTALSMLVGVEVMIGSFRRTVERWVTETFQADLVVAPATRFTKGLQARLPETVIERVRTIPGVKALDAYRRIRIPFRGTEVEIGAGDLAVLGKHGRLLFLQGESGEILSRAKAAGGVIISEAVALTHGLTSGSSVTVQAPRGPVTMPVIGVFYSYTTEGGRMVMDRSLFQQYWPDEGVNVLALYLEPGASRAAVEAAVREAGKGAEILVLRNEALRRRVLTIFDQTFAVTYALRLIALVVGGLGVFHALWAGAEERAREMGILRAVGAERKQIVRMIVGEAVLLGGIAEVLALPVGLLLSLVLIEVINKQSFGWSILLHFPPMVVVTSAVLALGTAALAGLLPAWRASRVSVADVLREE